MAFGLVSLFITLSAFGGLFPDTFSVANTGPKNIEDHLRCVLPLIEARAQFLAGNPEFESDAASVAVFADRLQELGSSYGDYLSRYAARHPRNSLDTFIQKNAATWFPEPLVRDARNFFFDSTTGRLRGIEFRSFARFAEFRDHDAFRNLGLDTLVLKRDQNVDANLKWRQPNIVYNSIAKTLEVFARDGALTRLSVETTNFYDGDDPSMPLLTALNRQPSLKNNLRYLRLKTFNLYKKTSIFTNFFENLPNVSTLELNDAYFSLSTLRSILKMPKLTRLSLKDCGIADHSGMIDAYREENFLEILSRATQLEQLDLEMSPLFSLDALEPLTALKNLASLNIRPDRYGDAIGKEALATLASGLPNLRTLVLGDVARGQHALEALAKARNLTELHLPKSLSRIKPSAIGLDRLRAARPDVKIIFDSKSESR